ncbi:hypothetical protein DPMN_070853 [Dreissena polymorpha]|uniref:Uncharacterized protein n=1 Tax=Dreissena polymorpha TaxID=45954 RepID=A0A9D4BX99_DREPO|nr:hypothetical protein DPMN_070853 [Dreissena polymorpha]
MTLYVKFFTKKIKVCSHKELQSVTSIPEFSPRAIRQRTSVVDVDNESNTSERGTTRQSIVGASRRANPLDMGKGFGRR